MIVTEKKWIEKVLLLLKWILIRVKLIIEILEEVKKIRKEDK